MSPTQRERKIKKVKLHVRDGVVYWDDGLDGGVKTLHVSKMDQHDFLAEGDHSFVFGTSENAMLLARLFESVRKSQGPSVGYVGGSGLSEKRMEKISPVELLQHMDSIEHGASGSGWHRMTEDDYVMYQLVDEVKNRCHHGKLTPHAESLLHQHPAWPAVEFVGGKNVDEWATAQLLAMIVEPRWYFDEESGRVSDKLKELLGVGGNDAAMMIKSILESPEAAKQIYKRRYTPATYLLRSWAGPIDKVLETVALLKDMVLDPRMFLWHEAKAIREDEKPEIGVLRASQIFLLFLAAVWIDNMNPRWELLVPEYFFSAAPPAGVQWKQFFAAYKRSRTVG